MGELSDMIKNWNTDILKDEDRVYDSKDDINRLIKVIPLLGEGIIQMKTSTRNLMINGLPLDGKLYKGTGSATSGIVEVVPEGTDYVYHMAKSGTTQGAWSIKSTDTTSISQIPYVSEDVLFTNTLIKGSGTATLQFLDKDGNVLSEMTTPALTDTYQAFNVKGQLKDSVWSFKIVASDAIYFKQVMITRSSFPSDYMLSEEELEQLNIINTSNIDANTVTKSHAYQVIGLKNCPPNVSTSGLFINIQKDNFAQVFVPNDYTGIYYRVGVTTNRPNIKWIRLATSDNTYSKEDFTEMRTSDNINLIQDSSMSAGFWKYSKDNASTSSGSIDVAKGIAHITGNGNSGTSWAQYQVTNQDYNQPLLQNSEIQYDQEYTASVETSWSEGSDIASNDIVSPSLVVRENYKDGTSKDLVHVKAVDKYGHDKWHKLSGTFKFSEDRKNDISFIQVVLMWQGAKGDVYFRRPKLEMASLPSAYIDDTIVSVEPNHNLLQDSRDLLDGWQSNGAKVSLDTTGDMAWYQGMRVQHQFGDLSYYGTTKTPVLENGKYYTVSAYMRGLSEGNITMYATILTNKSNSSNINFPLAKHLTGEWKRYSYTFKFDANTQVVNTSAIRVEGQGDWASNGGSVYVAGIKLEEGKTATDWSPSIEETIVRYETQNWQKSKITSDDGGVALTINVSGTDSLEKQFLSATGTKTFFLQGGATGNNTGDSLRGILLKDTPTNGNAYGINNKNELWTLKIQDNILTDWVKVAKDTDVMQIKSTVDGINSTLSSVQTQVQNSAVGTNLLTGTQDWQGEWKNLSLWQVDEEKYKGLTVRKRLGAWNRLGQHYDAKPNTTYTFSFYAKASEASNIMSIFTLDKEDWNSPVVSPPLFGNRAVTTEWQRYSVTFTTKSGGTIYPSVCSNKDGITIYVAGYKLEKGSLATDWCPNPAQVTEQLTQTASKLKGLELNVSEYGIEPNTNEDITERVKTLIETGADIVFPSGHYVVNGGLQFNHGQSIRCVGKVVLDGTNSTADTVLHVKNEGENYELLPALINSPKKGDIEITFNQAHNLIVGDIICIADNTDYSWSSARPYYRKGEFCEVAFVVNENTIILANELFDTYQQTDNPNFMIAKMNMGEFTINGNLEVIQGKKGIDTFGIRMERVKNFVSDKISAYAKNGNYAAFAFEQCYNCEFNGTAVQTGNSLGNIDYGLAIINSQHIRSKGYFFGRRHGIAHTGVATIPSIVNRDCMTTGTVKNSQEAESGVMAFNLHGNVSDIEFNGIAYGGVTIGGEKSKINAKIYSGKDGIAVYFAEVSSFEHDFSGSSFFSTKNPRGINRGVFDFSGASISEVDNMKAGRLNLKDTTLIAPESTMGFVVHIRNKKYVSGRYEIDLSNSKVVLKDDESSTAYYITNEVDSKEIDYVSIKDALYAKKRTFIKANTVVVSPQKGSFAINTNTSTNVISGVVQYGEIFPSNANLFVTAFVDRGEVAGKEVFLKILDVKNDKFSYRLVTSDGSNFGIVNAINIFWMAQ